MSVFRAGRVLAPDSKWTGEEPDWHGWESWTIETFMAMRSRTLNFYNYYLDASHMKPMVLEWMKTKGYTATEIGLLKEASPNILPSTVGKLIRAMSRGMPPMHPNAAEYYEQLPFHEEPPTPKSDLDTVKKEISTALVLLAHQASLKKSALQSEDGEPILQKAKVTPLDRINEKIDKEVIPQLDALVDSWGVPADGISSISMAGLLRDCKVPAQGCKKILSWVQRYHNDYTEALEKKCPQFVEAYSFLTKPELKKIVKNLETMLADIHAHSKTKMSMRKPRTKKVKDASKQVSKLKYQTNSVEYNLDSVSPARIPLAQRLYTFNTKTRQLGVYFASGSAGFEVKGTSLKGFDTSTSFIATLRKPGDLLTGILNSTPKRLEKIFDGVKLTRKEPNGRFNEHTIILKIIETKV